MKKAWLSIITLAVLSVLCACNPEKEKGTEPVPNYKKLTNGEAVFESEANGLQRYILTLWTSEYSTASDRDYSESDVILRLDIITAASGSDRAIASGDYSFSLSDEQASTIVGSEDSALKIVTPSSYGAQYEKLVAAEISINSFNENYEIKGEVTDVKGNTVKFDYYGKLHFYKEEPAEQETVTFESAELADKTGIYSNILWGKERASDQEGTPTFSGILYTEGVASFGSYFSSGEYGDMWGGFAVSSNRDLEDLGMDYSNQFSVYAPQATKFAVGYAFGEWGGEYGNPVIEFSKPVAPVSADIANANKTYHYCAAHPLIGEDAEQEDLWVNLVIRGFNATAEISDITIPLARGEEVLDGWKNFDLSGLGTVSKLTFAVESNDTGEYGLNVPAFFCIDNIAYE